MEDMSHRFLVSAFQNCSDGCGWISSVVAALAYGTFGVPIKAIKIIDVHPFVLQSYKTMVMFLCSWFVLALGETARWTPWGLLSGLLWVIGGTGGIYGIQNAGMAVAVATWASIMIMVNFVVGIICFKEPVASFFGCCGAFLALTLGLVGMAVYSAPPKPPLETTSPLIGSDAGAGIVNTNNNNHQPTQQELQEVEAASQTIEPVADTTTTTSTGKRLARLTRSRSGSLERDTGYNQLDENSNHNSNSQTENLNAGLWRVGDRDKKKESIFDRLNLTKRQLGIGGAAINGIFTGSSLVPLHYAKKEGFGGATYMISFATGALLSNCLLWAIWFITKVVSSPRDGNLDSAGGVIRQTYESLPQWHFKKLWLPAGSAGLLLSIAMFGSILSVTYLGQGIGNSIIQSKILISGMWGILYYREVTGFVTISKWFLSASLAVFGILWLSYERMHAKES